MDAITAVPDRQSQNHQAIALGGEPHREFIRAIEARADVESLDELHHKRRELVREFAPLAAKFKGGAAAGTDAARKRHRALIAQKILVELEQKEGKAPSEAALERMANAHTEHIEFCNKLEQEYVKFIVMENDIAEINEKIRSREVELYSYNAELKLSR